MKDSIRNKLEKLVERHEEVSGLLADPQIIADNDKFRELSMEYSRLEPVVTRYGGYRQLLKERAQAQEMVDGSDAELRELGQEELKSLEEAVTEDVSTVEKVEKPKTEDEAAEGETPTEAKT